MNEAERYPPMPMPPRGADLPTEDGIPMETPLHRLIMSLLIESLELFWADRENFFVGGNMFLYFSAIQAKKNDFRGPDFFVVLDTEHRNRDSWILWEEGGQAPNVVLEITSSSTEQVDRGEKKRIYERVLRVPEYFLYTPATGMLEGYRLGPEGSYEPIAANPAGRIPSAQLRLELGVNECEFLRYRDRFVRFYTAQGHRLPSAEEQKAEAEKQKAEAEKQKAEAEKQKAEAEKRAKVLAERLAAYEARFGGEGGQS